MNIKPVNKVGFKGNFWLTTDVHSRLGAYCGTLSKIQDNINETNETTTLIDAGDNYDKTLKYSTNEKVLDLFASINPDCNMVFNLGNSEVALLSRENKPIYPYVQSEKISNQIRLLKQYYKNIHYISCASDYLEKNYGFEKGLIEPYCIIDDIVDGEKKKILIMGCTITNDRKTFDLETQKAQLKEVAKQIKEKDEHYDYAILITHNHIDINPKTGQRQNTAIELFDYVKNDLKIKNLILNLGGHPHSLIQDKREGVERIFPPAQGKGAIMAHLGKNGIDVPIMKTGKDLYNYTTLLENTEPTIIKNIDVNNPVPMRSYYYNILNADENYGKEILKMPINIAFRDTQKPLHDTCELATLITNTARDMTNTDFAFLLSMDFREKLPQKGDKLTRYRLNDTVNANKHICILEDLTAQDIKTIFNISLKNQRDPSNSNFFEFSDNIKIERLDTDNENKIKQIYIKENEVWKPLYDDNGETNDEFKDRKFSASTCFFVAVGSRAGLEFFANNCKNKHEYKDNQGNFLFTADILVQGLKNIEAKKIDKVEKSQLITVEE